MSVSLPSEQATACFRDENDERLVAIVEDDHDTGMLVRELLENIGFVVAMYPGPMEFLSADLTMEPSCILLDVKLHGMSGLDLQELLLNRGSQSQIVFITGSSDVSTSVRAMKAGAFDFLQKPCREQEIIDAVRQADLAYTERVQVSRAIAAFDARFHSLTVREREVLSGVVEGQLNKQIAASLGLSEITVKIHRASLMRKMQARSLAQLVKDVSLHLSFEASDDAPVMRMASTAVGRRFTVREHMVHTPA
ncbi:response regulator transcription factor [Rhizobium leguminosarum]|uniref:response regulator transcription factor n=1 Tax=Rhizobium leguminosarum TaxID=384 RepID=UPI001C93EDAA|nr:response regulator [Rhizobium leguminosarum]MBY5538246.1 response regulator transcription factor [Rhizobium leguminosarum]